MTAALDPQRTLRELKELRALTSDENGAQRVAFTPIWAKARDWLREKLEELLLEIHRDEAGNVWATLAGESDQALVIGGHIDSVPNGGWLDGSLNLLAGLEILRRIKTQYSGKPPVSVRLVDWADEEGARFGMSLFGSSACSGHINLAEARRLQDKDGIALIDALAEHGIDFERLKDSGRELQNAEAYIELHIEQGPDIARFGFAARSRARHLWRRTARDHFSRSGGAFRQHPDEQTSRCLPRRRQDEPGESTGSQTTMAAFARSERAPPFQALSPASSRNVASLSTNVTSTLPLLRECSRRPGIRATDSLREGDVSVSWERLMRIEPIPFDSELVALCEEAIRETCGAVHRMPSGPLHDAAEVARAGIPTVNDVCAKPLRDQSQ